MERWDAHGNVYLVTEDALTPSVCAPRWGRPTGSSR